MGPVELSVADLERSLDYWQRTVGLRLLERENGTASLGTDTELVSLTEEPGAQPDTGHTGLYHVALLVPDRPSLARWFAHAARDRVGLTGLSDHGVSEAIYLRDPDHHGIEIYSDRPRELWEGKVQRMGSWPLDLDDLLQLQTGDDAAFTGLPDGTTMGHVHLRVSDVDETIAFYRDVLGFDLMAQLGPEAAFLSAGGYHHHLGANTWESRGAGQPPESTATLQHFTILLPDEASRDEVAARAGGTRVTDPSGNTLVLDVAA